MNERLPKFKGQSLLAEIEKSTAGLTYISETDAAIEPYSGGRFENVAVENITTATPNEEAPPRNFFARLTSDNDWYDEKQRSTAKRFAELERLLEDNLRDLKMFRVGQIRIDIYVVGLDADSTLMGIKTKAVET